MVPTTIKYTLIDINFELNYSNAYSALIGDRELIIWP
jgi:hypothetical protein